MRATFVVTNLHLKPGGTVIAFLSRPPCGGRPPGDTAPRLQGGFEIVADDPAALAWLTIGQAFDVAVSPAGVDG